ncbi:MAG: transporter [Jatrophihabitantaceae bacterium]|nr:transporter [Jatrophihabitantaceae bacterium]
MSSGLTSRDAALPSPSEGTADPRTARADHGDGHGHPRRTKAIVAVLAVTGVLSALMQTIVVPLLGELPQLLSTDASNTSWVVTSTLLAAAVTTPISGRLADIHGKRRVLLACIALLILGSILCALTSSFIVVVIGRTLQGAATSVIPLGISILRDELPPERVGSAIALISATLGIGGSVGLVVSAVVAQNYDWHLLFWGSAVIGAIAMALVLLVVPESTLRTPAGFDVPGAIGLSAGLICLLLPLTKGAVWGWTSPAVIVLLTASAITLGLWAWFEIRTVDPVVDLRVSAGRAVLLTNIASIMTGFAMYGINLALPQLLQTPASTGYGLGQSMVVTGLCLAPGGVMMLLVSPLSAKLSALRGPRVTLICGLLVIALGYTIAFFAMSEVWHLILVSAVTSCGIALAFGAMPALIMGSVDAHETGAANGLNALMRSLGSSLSSAVVASILANVVIMHSGLTLPAEAAYRWVFGIGIAAALIAAALASAIPSQARQPKV